MCFNGILLAEWSSLPDMEVMQRRARLLRSLRIFGESFYGHSLLFWRTVSQFPAWSHAVHLPKSMSSGTGEIMVPPDQRLADMKEGHCEIAYSQTHSLKLAVSATQ